MQYLTLENIKRWYWAFTTSHFKYRLPIPYLDANSTLIISVSHKRNHHFFNLLKYL